MADNLEFHFPLGILLKEADLIITAAESNAARPSERLEGRRN